MNKTTKIKCPRCEVMQSEDIIDLTDGGRLDGDFKMICESCEVEFTVEFEFVSYVKTYLLNK